MATACGLLAANLIYAQPLLATIGRSFAVSVNQVGFIPMLGQLGYALGLIFIVPLGEKYNQRSLIVLMLCAVVLALALMAAAPTVALLMIASCLVGFLSIIPELIIPFAARLASSNERGRVVGTVLCGFLIGTPLATILSGFVGEHLGWRTIFWIAAAMMIVLAIVLRFLLPDDHSAKSEVSYPQLLGSLWGLLRSEPVLQEVSILGILVFGAFSVFWVTLSFILETPPYHYGSDVVGLFGLVGIAGALAALFVGRFADRRDARYANGVALAVILLGAQSNQAANEARIYSLNPAAWNRLNTVYILMFCLGGSLGSMLGVLGWSIARWNGVYGIACFMLLVALVFYVLHGKRIRRWRANPMAFISYRDERMQLGS
jgi:predicted MFS family arabinose efflux permease